MSRGIPSKSRVFYKLREQPVNAVRFSGLEMFNTPGEDTNAILDGRQAEGSFEVIHDPDAETLDILYPAYNESGEGDPITLRGQGQITTLDGPLDGNPETLTFTVNPTISDDVIKINTTLKIGGELLVVTEINGGTWEVTVSERGAHATLPAAHDDEAVVELWQWTVPYRTLTLSELAIVTPPSGLSASGWVDGIRLTWDWNVSAAEAAALAYFRLYYSKEEGIDKEVVGSYIDVVTHITERHYDFIPRTPEDAIDRDVFYFAMSALLINNNESELSNEVASDTSGLGVGTNPNRPLPADIWLEVVPGGFLDPEYLFIWGVVYQDASFLRDDLDATEVSWSSSDSWDDEDGFTTPLGSMEEDRPPASGTIIVDSAGTYYFSARVKNALTQEWSLWTDPVEKATSNEVFGEQEEGGTNTPQKFTLFRPIDDDGGLKVGIYAESSPGPTRESIWGWDLQFVRDPVDWNGSFGREFLGISGFRASSGATPVTLPIGTNILTVSGADFVSAGVQVGDPIVLYKHTQLGGVVIFPHGGEIVEVINSTTVKMSMLTRRAIYDAAGATTSDWRWFIGESWMIDDGTLVRPPSFFGNNFGREGQRVYFDDERPCSEPVYGRMRFGNYYGLGRWIYYDGSQLGSFNSANAALFEPRLLQGYLVEDIPLASIQFFPSARFRSISTSASLNASTMLTIVDLDDVEKHFQGFLDEIAVSYVDGDGIHQADVDIFVTIDGQDEQQLSYTSSLDNYPFFTPDEEGPILHHVRRLFTGGVLFNESLVVKARHNATGETRVVHGRAVVRYDEILVEVGS